MKLRRLVSMARLMVGSSDLKRPSFSVDQMLVSKQLDAAKALPPNSIKPLRVRPIDYTDIGALW